VPLRSAILALSPTIYWPLDDLGTLTATDISGGGYNGVYIGSPSQGAPGPESGTMCIAGVHDAGAQLQTTNPLAGTGPWSMLTWQGCSQFAFSGSQLAVIGNAVSTGIGTLDYTSEVTYMRNGSAIDGTGFHLTANIWHMVVQTFTSGGTREMYVDGVLQDSRSAGTVTAVGSTEHVTARLSEVGLLAHGAFWNRILSAIEVSGIFAAGPGTPPISALTGRNATDVDVLALENKLDTILASVRRTF